MSMILNDKKYNIIKRVRREQNNVVYLVENEHNEYFDAKLLIANEFGYEEVRVLKILSDYLNSECHPNLVCYYDSGTLRGYEIPTAFTNNLSDTEVIVILQRYINYQRTSNIKFTKLISDLFSGLLILNDAGLYYIDLISKNIIYNHHNDSYVITDFSDVEEINPEFVELASKEQAIILANYISHIKVPNTKNFVLDVLLNNPTLDQMLIEFSKLYYNENITIRTKHDMKIYLNGIMVNTYPITAPKLRNDIIKKFSSYRVRIPNNISDENLFILQQALDNYLSDVKKLYNKQVLMAYNIPISGAAEEEETLSWPDLLVAANIVTYPY